MAPQVMSGLGDGMTMAAAVQLQQQQLHHVHQQQQMAHMQAAGAMQQQLGVPGASYGSAAVATGPMPLPSLQMVQTSTQALV
jgi:hypothetical protein